MQEGMNSFPEIVMWEGLTPYPEAMARMEARVAAVACGDATEAVIFCEHPAVLTIGSSGKASDIGPLVDIPVEPTGRGGQVTYHGPGQRVVYLVVKLGRWENDIRAYVRWLQGWLISSLADLGVAALTTDDVGVWVREDYGVRGLEGNRIGGLEGHNLGKTHMAKIAAIGVRVRRGVAFHGIALNICNDLEIYRKFTPCGITDKGVTSLRALGVGEELDDAALMAVVDGVLKDTGVRVLPPLPLANTR